MPTKAGRPCRHPGCSGVSRRSSGLCDTHSRASHRKRGRNPLQSYYTTGWAKASKAFLKANPFCRECGRLGKTTLATVTDHITPHRGDYDLFWNEANWQPLCKPCHDRKTASEDGAPHAKPERLPTPSCRVRLVCGPPASGKTTYVERRKQPDDIVIDLDAIYADMSGRSPHSAKQTWLAAALRERNRLLGTLAVADPDRVAWVIVSAPIKDRLWWIERLQPELVTVLTTPAAECVARIQRDPERQANATVSIAAVHRWWQREVGI